MPKRRPITSLLTRGQILDAIRASRDYAHLGDTQKTELLLRQGIMPYSVLQALAFDVPPKRLASILDDLTERNKIEIIDDEWIIANPSDRTRPIATQYNVSKPRCSPRSRNATTYRVFGRDRLALWYIAANHDFSGSRGEGYGLWLLLRFFRQPEVQKIWREHIDRRAWQLPPDAQ